MFPNNVGEPGSIFVRNLEETCSFAHAESGNQCASCGEQNKNVSEKKLSLHFSEESCPEKHVTHS